MERTGLNSLEGKQPGNTPRPSIVHFLIFFSANASADTRGALRSTVPIGFSIGQRYWGTSVAESIRGSEPF